MHANSESKTMSACLITKSHEAEEIFRKVGFLVQCFFECVLCIEMEVFLEDKNGFLQVTPKIHIAKTYIIPSPPPSPNIHRISLHSRKIHFGLGIIYVLAIWIVGDS